MARPVQGSPRPARLRQERYGKLDKPVILYQHELFADGIARLLRAQGFDPAILDGRAEGALARLQELRPRMLLLEDNDTDSTFALRLSEILRENPNVGVIRLSTQSNQLSLFSACKVTATGAQDLVEAISRLTRCSLQPEDPSSEEPAALTKVD